MTPLAEIRRRAQSPVRVRCVEDGVPCDRDDALAVEEPLEIRLAGSAPLITMRTPGQDLELTAGLMLSEGLVRRREDFEVLEHCMEREHVVRVRVRPSAAAARRRMLRIGTVSSACGVCGSTGLGAERLDRAPPLGGGPRVRAPMLLALPARLRRAQGVFERTGGLHAAALFDARGRLRTVREDVGRHNALDKLLGRALLDDRLPLHDHLVLLSGRASYELLQKCIVAGVALVCSISAPSSYAVRMAREHGVTLVGFLRERRFNVYSCPERILGPPA